VGTPKEPAQVKPIVGLLTSTLGLLHEAHEALADPPGPVEAASRPLEWKVSSYYRAEMGESIWRQYVVLTELICPEALVEWKFATNKLEERWRTERGRRVNIDPGYVDYNKLVLASTKDAAHRVYLGRGIYAEATLRFVHGSFEAWSHTYLDYASEDAVEFFNDVRARYAMQVSSRSSHRAD